LVETRKAQAHEYECCAPELFGRVWLIMVDMLGEPATAALLGRSIKRASVHDLSLQQLVIKRDGFEYTYKTPVEWQDRGPEAVASLRRLAHELSPLLRELTGKVIVERLHADPDLNRCGVHFQEAE
jgi:hypothetical protein